MSKEIFLHIYSLLTEDELKTLNFWLKGHKQTDIANFMCWHPSNVSKKLKTIAEKFNHHKNSSDSQEYLVKKFSQYKPELVCQKLKDKYLANPNKIIVPERPEKLDSPP